MCIEMGSIREKVVKALAHKIVRVKKSNALYSKLLDEYEIKDLIEELSDDCEAGL